MYDPLRSNVTNCIYYFVTQLEVTYSMYHYCDYLNYSLTIPFPEVKAERYISSCI